MRNRKLDFFPFIWVLLVVALLVLSGCITPPVEHVGNGNVLEDQEGEVPDSLDASAAEEESLVDEGEETGLDGNTSSEFDEQQDPGAYDGDQEGQQEPGLGNQSSGGSESGSDENQNGGNGESSQETGGDKNPDGDKNGEDGKETGEDDGDGGGGNESGDEEKLPLWVEPSHGSAKVFAEGVNLTLEPPNMKGESEFVVDGSVVLGFLESDREYRVEVDGHEVSFVTKESPYSWSEEALVHPGVEFQNSGCTLGFIFQDSLNETLYALTAAHCVSLGEQIYIDGVSVGKVVAHRHGEINWDLALIRIYDRAKVSPSLPHFSGPTGLAGHVPDGDTLCFYGTSKMTYPIGSVSFTGEDGGARCGHKIDDWPKNTFMMSGPGGYFGDSGSPVIHYESGTAYGIHVAGYPGGYMRGNLICPAMDWLADDGFDLILATYRYDPGPPQPLTGSQGSQEVDLCH